MQRHLTDYDDTASGWERALYAFLAEKQRRSGSERTTQAYSRMLHSVAVKRQSRRPASWTRPAFGRLWHRSPVHVERHAFAAFMADGARYRTRRSRR